MRHMDQIEVFISIADEICGSWGLCEVSGNTRKEKAGYCILHWIA